MSKSQGSFAIKTAHGANLWYSTLNLESYLCVVRKRVNARHGVSMALSFLLGNGYPDGKPLHKHR